MIKKLAAVAALTLCTSAVAEENLLVQLCEGLNESVPSIVTAYELGRYPSEIKQLLNPGISELLTNQGIPLESQSVVFTMSNGIVDYTWLQYMNGLPAALIQNKISSEICSKFRVM